MMLPVPAHRVGQATIGPITLSLDSSITLEHTRRLSQASSAYASAPPAGPPSGSAQFGLSWLAGDWATTLQAFFHELGHNLGLGHAGRYDTVECEQCDWSCAMGACCRTRCLAAPHAWQVGGAAWAHMSPGQISPDPCPSQQLRGPSAAGSLYRSMSARQELAVLAGWLGPAHP
jgi:hypothetical protein